MNACLAESERLKGLRAPTNEPVFKIPTTMADLLQVNIPTRTVTLTRNPMTKLEMVQIALKVTGSSSSEDVAAFMERKFGVTIEAEFIPLYKASLLGRALVASSHCRDHNLTESAKRAFPQPT